MVRTAQSVVREGFIAYLRHRAGGNIHVAKQPDGKWRVRWRDFSTTKQDREFDTEDLARTFAKTIRYSDIEADIARMANEDIYQAACFWIEQHGQG